ncbi:UNVERIFIED_CONTAM: Tfp pilus assembly protein PilF [Acetivibrio alkalicellulosi]
MGCYDVLGIEPTKDKKSIKKAYSKQLKIYSPEIDPEGFQNIRSAYEEAMAKADEQDSEKKELDPIDQFIEEFKSVYKDFGKRIDESSWKNLLERDLCYQIDTSSKVSKRILQFIMDNFYFPNSILKLFDDFFSWTTKKQELYQEYPGNFIDFIVSNVQSNDSLRYEPLLNCSHNQDEFISEFYKGQNGLEQFDLYTAKVSIDKAKNICPDHPDLMILQGRYLSAIGRNKEAVEIFTEVIKRDENDLNAYYFRADAQFLSSRIIDAYEDYKKILEIKPDSLGSLYSAGKVAIMLEKYQEAVDYLKKANGLMQYNEEIRKLLYCACNFYIDELKDIISKNSEDIDLKFKLAQIYHLANRNEESQKIFVEIQQESDFDSNMYGVLCEVLFTLKKEELLYSILTKAIKKYPQDYKINHFMALLFHDMGKYEDAIEYYENAISLNSEDAILYNNKASALNKLKKFNEALENCNSGLKYNADMAYIYKNKGEALFGLQAYEESLKCCEMCLNIDPHVVEAYVIKMKIFNQINQYDEALYVYNKAFEKGLKDVKLLIQKARALLYLNKFDQCKEFCDMALELDEHNSEAYECKGLCYYSLEDYQEAAKCLSKAIELNEGLEDSYFYKALCLLNQSKREEAISVLEEGLKINPDFSARFHLLSGDIFYELSQYDAAYNSYQMALKFNSSNANVYYSIGAVLVEKSKFDHAISYFDKALEYDPSMVRVYIDKSHTLYQLGKFNECIECCDKAIELEADSVTAYQNKAWALYSLNKIDEAQKNCYYALKLNPNSENLLGLKLEILRKKELFKDALIVADRLLEVTPDSQYTKDIKNDIMTLQNNPFKKIKTLFKKS